MKVTGGRRGRGKGSIKLDFTEWGNDVDTSDNELPMLSLSLCGDGTRLSRRFPLYQKELTYCAF
jgi:hypothetical protein